MRHAFLVPSFALLASASLSAMEIGDNSGLTINGYGEAFAEVEHHDINNVKNTTLGSAIPADETDVEFPSDVAFKVGYTVDEFTLRSDIVIANKPQFDNDHVLLEQAFIDWRATDRVTLRAGRFQNTWLGWEGFHTPELWRVNHSAAWGWNVENHGLGPKRPFVSDGVGVKWADQHWSAEYYIVDDVLGNGPQQKASDKATGASFAYRDNNYGRVELGLAYDPNSVNNGDGTASNAFAVDINTDITAWQNQGWFFATECQIHRHPYLTITSERYGNDMVALAMANYAFAPGKASLTAMIDYVERGFASPDNEVVEYAVALLTKPHKQVRLNAEVFYWSESGKNADAYGGAAVILVQLP